MPQFGVSLPNNRNVFIIQATGVCILKLFIAVMKFIILHFCYCQSLFKCFNKHISFLRYGINCGRKKFHDKGLRYKCYVISLSLTLKKIINFVQLGFNLSNGVTDTLESSSILIYLKTHMGLYTQEGF
jgi:hypothetical protein